MPRASVYLETTIAGEGFTVVVVVGSGGGSGSGSVVVRCGVVAITASVVAALSMAALSVSVVAVAAVAAVGSAVVMGEVGTSLGGNGNKAIEAWIIVPPMTEPAHTLSSESVLVGVLIGGVDEVCWWVYY